jgi:protein-S-isoprenylcysteine O-methyltransferase Ste14
MSMETTYSGFMKAKSWIIVGIQLGCIIFLVVSGPVDVRIPWLFLLMTSILLGIWSVMTMRIRRLKIFPEPATDAQLVTTGPYRYIRHPMYTAVLLFSLALLVNHFTWTRLAVWLVLLTDLLVKLSYEEKLMAERFKEYSSYREKTWGLIPGVF